MNSKTVSESHTTTTEETETPVAQDPWFIQQNCVLIRKNEGPMPCTPLWYDGHTLCVQPEGDGPPHFFAWGDGMFLHLAP